MAWSARTSQLVCLSYLVAVVWVLNEVTQPGAYVTDAGGGFFSLFAPSPTDAPLLNNEDRMREARPVAFAGAMDLDIRSRFVRPSPIEPPPEPEVPPMSGERVVMLPTLPLPADDRLLPALLTHGGDDFAEVSVDPAQDALPSSMRLAAAAQADEVPDGFGTPNTQVFIDIEPVTAGAATFAADSARPADRFDAMDSEVVTVAATVVGEGIVIEAMSNEVVPASAVAASADVSERRPVGREVESRDRGAVVAGAQARPSAAPAAGPRRYRVQKGDTLRSIAQRQFGRSDAATIRRIVDANPRLKRNPNHLQVGQELTLPAFATPPSAGANPGPVAIVAAG
jgi:phage tail protein X